MRPHLLLSSPYYGARSARIYLVAPHPGEPAWRARKEIRTGGGEVLFEGAPHLARPYRLVNWVSQHVNNAGFHNGAGFTNYLRIDEPMRGVGSVQESWGTAVAALGHPAEVLVVRV